MIVFKLIFLLFCIVMMCICIYNGMYTENEVRRRMSVLGAGMMGIVIGIFIVLISIGGLI